MLDRWCIFTGSIHLVGSVATVLGLLNILHLLKLCCPSKWKGLNLMMDGKVCDIIIMCKQFINIDYLIQNNVLSTIK